MNNSKEVDKFTQRVLSNLRPKVIQNKTITGEMFFGLARNYVEAINSDAIPQISTALERVIQREMRKIYETLAKEYNQKVSFLAHKIMI